MPPFNPRIGNCWTWPTNGSKPTLSGNASGTYTTMPWGVIDYVYALNH
jgi:hypothetical protein